MSDEATPGLPVGRAVSAALRAVLGRHHGRPPARVAGGAAADPHPAAAVCAPDLQLERPPPHPLLVRRAQASGGCGQECLERGRSERRRCEELDRIETAVDNIPMPLGFADRLYQLRQHIELARRQRSRMSPGGDPSPPDLAARPVRSSSRSRRGRRSSGSTSSRCRSPAPAAAGNDSRSRSRRRSRHRRRAARRPLLHRSRGGRTGARRRLAMRRRVPSRREHGLRRGSLWRLRPCCARRPYRTCPTPPERRSRPQPP